VLLAEKTATPRIAMDDGHIDSDLRKTPLIDLIVLVLTRCLKV